jgi:hypothetical protein
VLTLKNVLRLYIGNGKKSENARDGQLLPSLHTIRIIGYPTAFGDKPDTPQSTCNYKKQFTRGPVFVVGTQPSDDLMCSANTNKLTQGHNDIADRQLGVMTRPNSVKRRSRPSRHRGRASRHRDPTR